MTLFRRRRHEDDEDQSGGTLIVDAAKAHRCEPPGAHEWPAGDWKIDQTKKYPEGTVWRCDCGKAWLSARYAPSKHFSMSSKSNGMWLNWYRDYEHDAEADA